MEWLDQFLDAGIKLFEWADFRTYKPFDFSQIHPYYSDLWIDRLSKTIKKLKEKNVPIGKIARTFPTLTTLRIETGLMLADAKISGLKKEKRLRIANFFNKLITSIAKEDYYGYKSCIVKDEKEIKETLAKTRFNKTNKKLAKNVGRLSSALSSLSWALYTDNFPNQSYETEGPYKLDKNRMLLIKKHLNLKPVELFPETSKIKHENIEIYAVYKNIWATFDFGNHIIYTGNAVDSLEKVAVFVDGKQVNMKEIEKLALYFEKVAQEQYVKYEKLSFEKKKILFLHQRAYPLRKFFSLAGVDWRPSKRMIDRVKNRKLIIDKTKYKSKEEELRAIRKMFDPRIEPTLKERLQYLLLRILYYR